MVRPNKSAGRGGPPTQKPQAPGLEAGGAYQESGAQKSAQKAIPLRDTAAQPPGTPPPGAVEAGVQDPRQPTQNPMEAAAGFPNTVTPLTAPGQNIPRPVNKGMNIDNNMRAAAVLKEWAATSDHAAVQLAAQQMEAIIRNG